MNVRVPRAVVVAAAVAAVAWAGWTIARQLQATDVAALRHALATLPARDLGASALFTAVSFAMLGTMEALACRAVLGTRVAPASAMARGAMAHALCNTVGLHALLAPGLRLALYRRDGAGAWDVGRIVVMTAAGIGLGSGLVALLAAGAQLAGGLGGLAALGIAVLVMLRLRHPPARLVRRVGEEGACLAPLFAIAALIETLSAMAALFVLLPDSARATPAHVALAFIASSMLGVVSHAPGGLGVFEAGMLTALRGERASLMAALVAFRVIYNLLPACIAAVAMLLRGLRAAVSSTAGTRGSRAAAPDTAAPAPAHRSDDARVDALRR